MRGQIITEMFFFPLHVSKFSFGFISVCGEVIRKTSKNN
jgi:hypothetical protein